MDGLGGTSGGTAEADATMLSMTRGRTENLADRLVQLVPRRLRPAAGRLLGTPIPRYLRASNFLFIHIPKTAGYSISQAIYGRQVWHKTALYLRDADPEFFSRRLSFAVVRNPWDRLVSAYEFCRSGGTDHATFDEVLPPLLLSSFRAFVLDFVLPSKDRLNTLDCVLREQNYFVNDREGNCLVNLLGRFEDLGAFQETLIAKSVLQEPIPHLNASAGRSSQDYRSYYVVPELVDAVAASYACDIRQFSYSFE